MPGCLIGGWQRGGGGASAGRGRGVGGRVAEAALRAVPGRARRADRGALRPRVLLGLHRGLAQPEARVPAVPRAVRHRRAGVRVQWRLLMRAALRQDLGSGLQHSLARARACVPAAPVHHSAPLAWCVCTLVDAVAHCDTLGRWWAL